MDSAAAAIKALAKAQAEMGAVIKNAKNLHLKSKYADLGVVIDATFPALHANGFAVLQPAGADERGPFIDTLICHESGHIFSSRVYLVIGKQDMQGVGSAHTYARRYGLLGMAGVAPEDDDGEGTKAPRRQQEPETQKSADPKPEDVFKAATEAMDAASTLDRLDRVWKALAARPAWEAAPEAWRGKASACFDRNLARLTPDTKVEDVPVPPEDYAYA